MSDNYLKDFPNGPLDVYRKQANFCWKEMKMVFELDKDCFKIKMDMWSMLSKDPLFSKIEKDITIEEMKKISAKRLHRFLQYNFVKSDVNKLSYTKRIRYMMTLSESLAIAFPDVSVKYGIGVQLVKNNLTTLGTERHKKLLDALWDGKIVACIALTEISHGSNTKQMKTTATYDKNTQEFIINTPDFQGAKCWSGNLGKTATMAVLFAQLIIDDNKYGLHAFVVPIRNPKTLLPYPGIFVGDMGPKIGLHGVDNGFIIFKNYKIPRENLLNKIADVTSDGVYETSFSEPSKILSAVLENLSLGRLGIMQQSAYNLINAVTIAIRYGAVRKQFSENGDEKESALIEFQLHQWRLFPYVSAAVVLKIFVNSFTEDYLTTADKLNNSPDRFEEINNLVSEIHSIVSGAKPLLTWTARNSLQECREACGGHGYLKISGFGLKNDHDPTCTYEGDNYVLQQQSSNWLLKQWEILKKGQQIMSPLKSAQFLNNFNQIIERKFNESHNMRSLEYIMECFEWLIAYLINQISTQIEVLQNDGFSRFASKNKVQVYRSLVLSQVYAELNALRYFLNKILLLPNNLRDILNQFGILYGLTCLDNHISYFYEGNFTNTSKMTKIIKETIIKLCEELKPNVLGIVDSLAPPDYILNSILGKSDGKVYEGLEKYFIESQGSSIRPDWWKEIIFENAPDFTKLTCKL